MDWMFILLDHSIIWNNRKKRVGLVVVPLGVANPHTIVAEQQPKAKSGDVICYRL